MAEQPKRLSVHEAYEQVTARNYKFCCMMAACSPPAAGYDELRDPWGYRLGQINPRLRAIDVDPPETTAARVFPFPEHYSGVCDIWTRLAGREDRCWRAAP